MTEIEKLSLRIINTQKSKRSTLTLSLKDAKELESEIMALQSKIEILEQGNGSSVADYEIIITGDKF